MREEKHLLSEEDLKQLNEEKTKLDEIVIQELNKSKEIIKTEPDKKESKEIIIIKPEHKLVIVPTLNSEKAIKEYYRKLEEISLDDGSILVGAIIMQNQDDVKIHTTHGIIKVPISSIKNVKMR